MKRLLFLLLGMVLSLALVACDEEDSSSGSDDSGNTEEVSQDVEEAPEEAEKNEEEPAEEESSESFGMGDTAEVGGISFTVTGVSTTDERNEFEEEDPNIVVAIEYEIENGADEEIPIGMDLQVYDGTGSQMDQYPLDNTMGSLQPGKKIQGVEHFGIEEGPIEVYFQPALSFDDPAIFELDVE